MGILKQYLAGLSASFGGFCLGSSEGWSGPVQHSILAGTAYKFTPTLDDFTWTASLFHLGAASMCMPSGVLIAAFGRKLVMLLLAVPFFLGWACILFAQHVCMLFIGRFVLGACSGAYSVAAPIYTTEIAEVKSRGIMGFFFQLMIVNGTLFSFIAGSYCSVETFNILCSVMSIVLFVLLIWVPESPVYLVQQRRPDKAQRVLRGLRGADADLSADMAILIADNQKKKVTCGQAFSRKTTIRGIFISVTLMVFQEFTGICAITFYVASVFEEAGTGIPTGICTIIIGAVSVISTIPATMYIDRLGRKMLLIFSGVLMGITTLVLGFYYMGMKDLSVGWVAVTSVCVYEVGYSVGYGPVPWLVMAELFAEDVKPICGAIVATFTWLFAFAVTKLFPVCVLEFGSAITFWGFAVISFVSCIFVIFCVPETKGKSLDEIQQLLKGK
ncbi:facilitated trehalose transporter Tret1-like isoform X1 [Drosophila novamexicana]|uniref:facilitated trehalose transporter Tret1-like isoform X1 n=2 Tax=Drosophila novamexicana TaxID=47314 RepID=UPI0011E601F7|nr:facilitated trehalose transporter Tret1-like isoform X1 [Drosophila novamexicana]